MDLKKKIDNFAKGREDIRLLLYVIFLPIMLPYQLIEFFHEVRPERSWKETFLSFFVYSGLWFVGTYMMLIIFPDLADKYINSFFLSDSVAMLAQNPDLIGERWILVQHSDLSGWISMAMFGLFIIIFLLIYIFVLSTKADNYRKMLIEAKLIKSNLLDQILFGRLKTEK